MATTTNPTPSHNLDNHESGDPAGRKPFACLKCRQVLAYTDGKRLYTGASGGLDYSAKLTCLACGDVRTWKPMQ